MDPNITEIRIGPTPGFVPGLSTGGGKARITPHKEAKEVMVQEDMPLGIKMTLVYRLCDRPVEIEGADNDQLLPGLLPVLYSEVEKSVLAPRPLSLLVKAEDRLILQTRNLLGVLVELGRNGRDLGAALGWLDDGDYCASGATIQQKEVD